MEILFKSTCSSNINEVVSILRASGYRVDRDASSTIKANMFADPRPKYIADKELSLRGSKDPVYIVIRTGYKGNKVTLTFKLLECVEDV